MLSTWQSSDVMEVSKVFPISPTVSSTCRSFRLARFRATRTRGGEDKRAREGERRRVRVRKYDQIKERED